MEKQKAKKPIYKRWWFWVVIIIVIVGCFGNEEDSNNDSKQVATNIATKTKKTMPKKETKVETKTVVEDKNLGVNINSIKSIFENSEIGFTFSSSPLQDGTRRQLGQSPKNKGAAMLELYGVNKLTKAYLGTFAANDSQEHNLFNLTYMLGLLNNVCPELSEPGKWLNNAIKDVANNPSKIVTKQVANKIIKVSLKKELGLFELIIDTK